MTTQTRRFLGPFARWLCTVIVTALLIAVAQIYRAKDNFSSSHKAAFYIVVLSLSLLLGLNFYEAFKELANVLKHQALLAWAKTSEEKKLIAHFDIFFNVWRLWWKTTSKPLQAFCAFWILLLLVAQLSVSLTSLTYTVNDGVSYNDTYIRHGVVNVSDLSCYHMQYLQEGCPTQVSMQTVAHTYGDMSLGYELRDYDDIAEVLNSKHNYRIYRLRPGNNTQFAYRFNEYNPSDKEKVYPYFTNRTIVAESLGCFTYNETSSDGKEPNTFTYSNGTSNGTIEIPNEYLGSEGTTYMYLGKNDPASAPRYSCGPRCVWMWVYKNPSGFPKGSPEPTAFYQCPVNISIVNNASKPEHSVPDNIAKLAAASIALQGRFSGPQDDKDWRQFQFYASGSAWEIHHTDANGVGRRIAKFALGSLASMATFNPTIQISGHLPILGHNLHIYVPYFVANFSFIVLVHLAIVAAIVCWVEKAGYSEDDRHELRPRNGHRSESRDNLV